MLNTYEKQHRIQGIILMKVCGYYSSYFSYFSPNVFTFIEINTYNHSGDTHFLQSILILLFFVSLYVCLFQYACMLVSVFFLSMTKFLCENKTSMTISQQRNPDTFQYVIEKSSRGKKRKRENGRKA